ncbi:MAG: tail fiber domain-containing protein [Candidatus Gastranaerophilales bacterium]|nr:tail fiber domain-containing protein [Candidatus Gastranaerophilales bacterium]
MKSYTNGNPQFSESIQITEATDLSHADNVNPAPMQLLQNDLVLRETKVDKEAGKSLVSDTERTEWNATYQQATSYTDQKIADLIGGAPSTLDTLGEIAKAMGDNKDVVEALEEVIGKKANEAEFDSHVKDTTAHVTAEEREKWNSKAENVTMKAASASYAGKAGLVPAPAAGDQGKYLRGDGTWDKFPADITGNAGTATKMQTARTLDGVLFSGEKNIIHYGTCTTASSTATKTVGCIGFVLEFGATIKVKFINTNIAANPTLNVQNTGAKAIYYRSKPIAAEYLVATHTYEFVYNGSEYELVGDINTDTNTTYVAATASPKLNGLATIGTSARYAREDHAHPNEATIICSGTSSVAYRILEINSNVVGTVTIGYIYNDTENEDYHEVIATYIIQKDDNSPIKIDVLSYIGDIYTAGGWIVPYEMICNVKGNNTYLYLPDLKYMTYSIGEPKTLAGNGSIVCVCHPSITSISIYNVATLDCAQSRRDLFFGDYLNLNANIMCAERINAVYSHLDNIDINTLIAKYKTNYKINFDMDGFYPIVTSTINLGNSNYKWKQLYASTSTISTSDRSVKKNISALTDKHVEFFKLLQPVSFQFIDGDSGRTHIGFISQDVEDAMKQAGLTSLDFAGFCKDIQKQFTGEYKDDGTPIVEAVLDENGDPVYIYSLRYEEFIALNTMIIQRHEDRIAILEEKLDGVLKRLEKVEGILM